MPVEFFFPFLGAAGLAFLGAQALALRRGTPTRLLLILGSPLFLAGVGLFFAHMSWGWDSSCEDDCVGNLVIPYYFGALWIGTEAGGVTGWVRTSIRREVET